MDGKGEGGIKEGKEGKGEGGNKEGLEGKRRKSPSHTTTA